MASVSNLLTSAPTGGILRPFDARRDLAAVADLVETCFSDTLDADGTRYLNQMRSAARSPNLLRWASSTDLSGLPTTGYVWEEDGRLVGNLSLIPYQVQGRRQYLIANVGVHPAYRRRGIGRRLTIQGIEHARRRGSAAVWLHVRENNAPAVTLYRELGFTERARRTTWYSAADFESTPFSNVKVHAADGHSWPAARSLFGREYPPELTWHLPFKLELLRPGLVGAFHRLINGAFVQSWVAQQGNQVLGFLAWQSDPNYPNTLWLAAEPQYEDLAARALLLHARWNLSTRRVLVADYPAHRAEEAFKQAGFYIHQTLIWMEIPFH